MTEHKLFAIKKTWPVFQNPEIEDHYKQDNFPENKRAIARGLFGVYVFFFLFVFAEIYMNLSEPFADKLSMGLKLICLPLGWLCHLILLQQKNERSLNILTACFFVLYLFILCLQLYLYNVYYDAPPNSFELSIPFAYLTILLYMFAPLRVEAQATIATFIIISFFVLSMLFYPLADARFTFGLTYVVLSNIFGLIASYYINRNLRSLWAGRFKLELNNQALESEVKYRKELEENFKRMAMTDSLTGIENRRSFMKQLERALSQAQRTNEALSLIMFDIDYFKSINDVNGHAVGDVVLKRIADTVASRLRQTDVFGRVGGEEFAVFLPNADLGHSNTIAEELRVAIEQLIIEDDGKTVKATASFGVSASKPSEQSRMLLKRADMAMYRAKEKGRNRVEQSMF